MLTAHPRFTRPNPRLDAAVGTTTLVYALETDPSPLTASLSTADPVRATLLLIVTNPLPTPVSVSEIGLTLQMGTEASELGLTTDKVVPIPSDQVNWVGTSPSSTVTEGAATWIMGPATGDSVILPAGASLTVTLPDIEVNAAVGTSELEIVEKLDDGTTGQTSFGITKTPYGFYFDSLVANTRNGSVLTPVAQVTNGTSVVLTWNGSILEASAYTVLYATNLEQQTGVVTAAGQWTSPALVRDTVFVVQVAVSSTADESLTFTLVTSVAVAQPDLIAQSVSAVTLGATGAVSAGTLDVAGAATVFGTLSVTGSAPRGAAAATRLPSAAGDAGVMGAPQSFQGVEPRSVAETLPAPGEAAPSSLVLSSEPVNAPAPGTVSADTVVVNSVFELGAAGTSSSFGMAQPLTSAAYQTTSDGFVVGWATKPVQTPFNYALFNVDVTFPGAAAPLTIPSFATVAESNTGTHSLSSSFCVPIPKGTTIGFASAGSGETLAAYFIPFGPGGTATNVSGGETLAGLASEPERESRRVPRILDEIRQVAEGSDIDAKRQLAATLRDLLKTE
jgi:hypothetical protein